MALENKGKMVWGLIWGMPPFCGLEPPDRANGEKYAAEPQFQFRQTLAGHGINTLVNTVVEDRC